MPLFTEKKPPNLKMLESIRKFGMGGWLNKNDDTEHTSTATKITLLNSELIQQRLIDPITILYNFGSTCPVTIYRAKVIFR